MRNLKFMVVENGKEVITQGDEGDKFYVVLNGTFSIKIAHLVKVPEYTDLKVPKNHRAAYSWLLTLLDNYHNVFWAKIPYAKVVS